MAIGTVEFHSDALGRFVSFRFVSPNDYPQMMIGENPHYQRPMKTLYLLHGFHGSSSDWLLNSRVSEYAMQYNMTVIFPSGENSFYLDQPGTGGKYGAYIGEELVEYTRRLLPLSDRRENTFIGGLSMGGFGALHTALAYPETFGKAFSLSGALIIHDVKSLTPGSVYTVADYDYYAKTFGDLAKVVESRNNPETLVRENQKSGIALPDIYLAIGTEDTLYEANQIMRNFLKEHEVAFTYEEGPGDHNFDFWDPWCKRAMDWLTKEQ